MSDTLSLVTRAFLKEGNDYPRYYSLMHPEKVKKDTRTGDEIVADTMKNAGLKYKE